MNGNDLWTDRVQEELQETVLGIVGNVGRIRIIIVKCSTDVTSQCFITDQLQ